MKAYYYNNGTTENPEWSNNWGDIIGPTIVKYFSKSNSVQSTEDKVEGKLVSIGSVMAAARPTDAIWGTGIIKENHYLPDLKRVDILAVRGPKTREQLLYLGHEVPEVYGDPGLLYPQIYNPEVEKTHEWGIIPHYVDLKHPAVQSLIEKGVKLIDICAGEKEFVDQLKSVEKVLSSSLHGLIAADAYGIPNARVNLTGFLDGGDYKFEDYALSVNRNHYLGQQLPEDVSIELINSFQLNEFIEWDAQKLLDAAPWNNEKYKHLFPMYNFIHINKCGGTSLKNEFAKHSDIKIPGADNLINFSYSKAWNDYKSFTIVRNPIDRILSLQGMMKKLWKINITVDEILDIVEDHNIGYSFKFGHDKVNDNYIKRHALPMTHPHYQVYKDGKINVERYWKLEELNEVMPEIEEFLGRKLDLKKLNASKKKQATKEEIKRIRQVYAKDFEVFYND